LGGQSWLVTEKKKKKGHTGRGQGVLSIGGKGKKSGGNCILTQKHKHPPCSKMLGEMNLSVGTFLHWKEKMEDSSVRSKKTWEKKK